MPLFIPGITPEAHFERILKLEMGTGIIEAYRVLEILNEIYDTSLIKYNYIN